MNLVINTNICYTSHPCAHYGGTTISVRCPLSSFVGCSPTCFLRTSSVYRLYLHIPPTVNIEDLFRWSHIVYQCAPNLVLVWGNTTVQCGELRPGLLNLPSDVSEDSVLIHQMDGWIILEDEDTRYAEQFSQSITCTLRGFLENMRGGDTPRKLF